MSERAPETDWHFADGILVKSITLEAGCAVPQHAHAYDHTSFVASGEIMAWRDGIYLGHFVAPCGLNIPAGTKHAFVSVLPTVLLCIHNLGSENAVRVLAEHEMTLEDVADLAAGVR